jgi:hypothetical protein
MKVSVKKLSVEIPIKNKGIEIEVRETDGSHLGDLVITKSGLTWCKGRTRRENGKFVSWGKFIDLLSGG